MAYVVYRFNERESFEDIASIYNCTVSQIMTVNNIQPPYPLYPNDLSVEDKERLSSALRIPYVGNGNDSFESYTGCVDGIIGVEYKDTYDVAYLTNDEVTGSKRSSSVSGAVTPIPGRCKPDCYVIVNGTTMHFPCYPESISDTDTANYSAQNILGRSEPFQIYNNSGPRTVSVSFTMHREMVHNGYSYEADYDYVENLVNLLKSACYPNYGSSIAAVKVTLVVGKNTKITGIIGGNVNDNWSGPIIDGKYQMVDVSFSVVECTGNPLSQSQVKSLGGYR